MHIHGACHCGQVRYEADIDPDKVMICHCTDCQIISGGPYRWGVLVLSENFRLLAGRPTLYEKSAESGAKRVLAFCGCCGTSLWGGDAIDPSVYSLRLSSSPQARNLKPSLQIWTASRLDWVCELSTIQSFQRQPSAL